MCAVFLYVLLSYTVQLWAILMIKKFCNSNVILQYIKSVHAVYILGHLLRQ